MPETNLEPTASDRVYLFGQGKLTHSILPPREALHGDKANLEESKMCTWDLWAQKRLKREGLGEGGSEFFTRSGSNLRHFLHFESSSENPLKMKYQSVTTECY